MLTVELMGGLGNQLFQIYTLLATVIKNRSHIVIEKKKMIGSRQVFYWDSIFKNINRYVIPKSDIRWLIFKQNGYHFTEIKNIDNKKFIKLFGYFQSYKYFNTYSNRINSLLGIHKLQDALKDKYDYNNSISIHFRVGDYLKTTGNHPVLTKNYYVKALQTILDKLDKLQTTPIKVLYFGEKQDKVHNEKIINILRETYPKLEFIKVSNNYTDWQQMLIMSLCEHNIIANSTFSWWGAYFNSNSNKIVTFPSIWFGPKLNKNNTKDLCPPNWIKI